MVKERLQKNKKIFLMKYAIITGSNGLVGSEAVDFFIKKNLKSSLLIIIFEGTFLEKMLTLAGKRKFKSKNLKTKFFITI